MSEEIKPQERVAQPGDEVVAEEKKSKLFPELEEIQQEIDRRIRDNKRFLERFLDEDFDDDEDTDEGEDFEEL